MQPQQHVILQQILGALVAVTLALVCLALSSCFVFLITDWAFPPFHSSYRFNFCSGQPDSCVLVRIGRKVLQL
jgi:hypothetical protein